MKILMVIDSLDKGGKERRMLELIKGLLRRPEEFNIYLVSLTDKIEYKYVYDLPIKFEVLKRKYKKDPALVLRLKKIINEYHPDIIHSWSTMASVYLSFSNPFGKIPLVNAVIADAHNNLNLSDKHYFRVKLTTPFSNVFVANSKAGISSYKTPPERSVCIYNGIDFDRFQNLRPVSEVEVEILGRNKGSHFVMAMVASFDERKDFQTVIKAAIKICQQNSKLIFVLVGHGPAWEACMSVVPPELLNSKIIFTGRRDDIESILQIVDVGLLMTNSENHAEGISNAIIEFMAMGKPVIASRGGGTDEVVLENFNGFIVDPHSEKQLIEKIEVLYEDRNLLARLGDNAFRWVREQFDMDKKTSEYVALYDRLRESKRTSS
jgi:glycosyltransferase involved in cell wall biosynthesis